MEEEDKIAIEKMIEDLVAMASKYSNAAISHLEKAISNDYNMTLLEHAIKTELSRVEITNARYHLEQGMRRYLRDKKQVDAKARAKVPKQEKQLERRRMQEAVEEAKKYINNDQTKQLIQNVLKLMMEKKQQDEPE